MDTTYDVRIWKTDTYRGKRGNTYYVRWGVSGKPWKEPFKNSTLADSFRSELVSAARKGEAFNIEDYWIFNANLSFRPDDSPFEFGLWARNIFNEDYDETRNTFNSGARDDFSVPGRPATFGLRVGVRI